MMFLQPIDIFVYAWLAIAVLSAIYVAWDQFRGNPEPTVMKWGFVLITLYMGPIGLLLYVMADKEPAPGTHEAFVQPLWKQGVGSAVHCVAGDATGIILAAVVVSVIGLPMWADLIVEYAAGFLFGLLIFQSLFMRKMMGGSYLENVRKSFMPEFISMNAMMAGMAPVMVLLMMGRDMRAMWPGEPLFWFVMSLGVTAGYAVTYPVNVWLVSRGMKHGLMTVRDDAPAQHDAPSQAAKNASHDHGAMASMPAGHAMPADTGMGDGKHDASAGHGMHGGGKTPTRAQLVAVTAFTSLMLIAGMTLPSAFVNMRLSAHEVGKLIMPPGMITTQETPAATMRDMAGIDPRESVYTAPVAAQGDQLLPPQIVDGVKVFHFDLEVIQWSILADRPVNAYAVNRQVPGPRIELEQGDHVRFVVTNHLPESTTLHWHGLIVPNAMDGPAVVTQKPIAPGATYTYDYVVPQVGTYFYHSHDHPDRQQSLGLYGALIVRPTHNPDNLKRLAALHLPPEEVTAAADPAKEVKADHEYTLLLQEWLARDGITYPAMNMEGGLPNYFTINGKAYPSTDTVKMRVGETIKIRFIGSNTNFVHPMHIHGGPFTVVARDGVDLPKDAQFQADTVNVGPGQRYDVIWTARKPGRWLVHCHIPHHTTNNNQEQQGGGGLMMVLDVLDANGHSLPMPAQ
jgi:FtsP/CotA-like multicopper oxidase with cupredoxin domain